MPSALKHFAGQRKKAYIKIRFLKVINKLFKMHYLILCRKRVKLKEIDFYPFSKGKPLGYQGLESEILNDRVYLTMMLR